MDGTTYIATPSDPNVNSLIELSDGTFTPEGYIHIRSGGVYRQTGGSSIFSDQIAINDGGIKIESGGVMEISGGTMYHTSRIYGIAESAGTLRVIGDEATITIHQPTTGFAGTFEFIFDETGISKLHNDYDNWSSLAATRFVVDANDYTGPGGDFVLYTGMRANTNLLGSNYEVILGTAGTEYVGWTWEETITDPHTITLTILSKLATMPDPTDGEAVTGAPVLGWRAGDTAVSHNVYLDTVNPPSAFEDNVLVTTGTSYDPGPLPSDTYYWRIDAVDAGAVVHPGEVWSFTLDAGAASDMTPLDEATGVAVDVTLAWTAGGGTITHDVYLGMDAENMELVAEDLALAPAEYKQSRPLIKGVTY